MAEQPTRPCPECVTGTMMKHPNGTEICDNYACIRFPYITFLNQDKFKALHNVTPNPSAE